MTEWQIFCTGIVKKVGPRLRDPASLTLATGAGSHNLGLTFYRQKLGPGGLQITFFPDDAELRAKFPEKILAGKFK